MERFTHKLIGSRRWMVEDMAVPVKKSAEEGGCGVVGFACSQPVRGRHIFEPSMQMHNRGNGKGGGIAAAAFLPAQLGVSAGLLRDDYILQLALFDPQAAARIEEKCVTPFMRVDHQEKIEPAADYRDLGLEVRPPDIVRYFIRVKTKVLSDFTVKNGLADAPARAVEDEFIYQNSARLNREFYASLGEKQAFVLSHARDLMIFKIVGYAEQVVKYYGLEDLQAKVWIAHQRYPTKGRVWHPAGSHPFIGMQEALVHNGDFANYYNTCECLRQYNIAPHFLTDTEVSVLLFDLWSRTFGYPLEYVIEAMAPTTELDFDQLPPEKQRVYRHIQAQHVHGSPDGPWFFIIARSDPDKAAYQLLGITDTAMLRPQVFAIQEGDVSIGLVASEKQAIDATLRSLASEDHRFRTVADRYWNARGGSHTDGGAFAFTVSGDHFTCADKFEKPITAPPGEYKIGGAVPPEDGPQLLEHLQDPGEAFGFIKSSMGSWSLDQFHWVAAEIAKEAKNGGEHIQAAVTLLSLLNDRRYDTGKLRRSALLQIIRESLDTIFDAVPPITGVAGRYARIDWETRRDLHAPRGKEETLVIHARGFPPEGDDCDARLLVRAYELGWRRFIVYGLCGQRFHGCGLGSGTKGVRIDVYGCSGDYLGSGIDGLELVVHDNGQDQLAQIMKSGRLVIHGDVGQAFMYGAKGGEVYVLGNGAGRPLINAVGRPRVVINGTCLDFLAESFMAGDPHKGGGFVVLNGVEFDDKGNVREQPSPYPGSNLFSLASGGAIFVRDPHQKLIDEQLNGGEFVDLSPEDWNLIKPYLETNEDLFGISIERDLLTVNGEPRPPEQVYRKVRSVKLAVLAKQAVPE
jgi:glutamate synthase domain-containing protein 1/glutamate synthase domain-containing protein 3